MVGSSLRRNQLGQILQYSKALADVAGTRDEVRDGLIGGRGHLRLSGVLLSGKFINDALEHLF